MVLGRLRIALQNWLIIPFKKPASELPNNGIFNAHLSRIHIRSEHAIGYLKGRFQSLRDLRDLIYREKDIKYAITWVNGVIALNAFCINHEKQIDEDDAFLQERLAWSNNTLIYELLLMVTELKEVIH